MAGLHRSPWALLAGVVYAVFSIFPGMGADTLASNIAWISLAVVVTTGVAVWHTLRCSPASLWLHPLLFALPMLALGVVAMFGGITTVFFIGAATFLVGLVAVVLTNIYTARSNYRIERSRER